MRNAQLSPPSRWRRLRPVLAPVCGGALLAGTAAILAIAFVPLIEHPAFEVTLAPKVVPPTPAMAPETIDALGCTAVVEPDDAIGIAIERGELDRITQYIEPESESWHSESTRFEVAASPNTPHLAVLYDSVVRVSDDDGRTFHRVFEHYAIRGIAMGKDGVLYAHDGFELAVRTPDGKVRQDEHPMPMSNVNDSAFSQRLAMVGDGLVWLHEDRARGTRFAVTYDRGATWSWIGDRRSPSNTGKLYAWRGSLYQLEDENPRSGLAMWPMYRFDPRAKSFTQTTFASEQAGEHLAAIAPSDDSASEWTWRGQCWVGPAGSQDRRPCTMSDSPRWQMLAVRTLRPVEGGRTLAVYQHSLVEVCQMGARQIYRRFPFAKLEAVDSAGRPIVATETDVLRWSPGHGWRKIFHADEMTE